MNRYLVPCILCLLVLGSTSNVVAQGALGPRNPGDTCGAATLEVSGIPFLDSSTTVGETKRVISRYSPR